MSILAIQGWIRRTVDAIDTAVNRPTRPTRRCEANLREMAEVNRWLIDGAPRTLREACQWIAWFNMASRTYNRDGAGGQTRRVARPYYERDRRDKAASTTRTRSSCWPACCLNDPHYYQLGGPAPDGRDQTSHLSFLILEAAHRLQSTCNLTIRVHDGLDPRLLRKGVEYLIEDRKAWPQVLRRQGPGRGLHAQRLLRPSWHASASPSGCNWMALPGLEYTMNDTVKINVAKVFMVAFDEMMAR